MITLNETENGNLEIILNDKEELKDLRKKGKFDNDLLWDMLEDARYIGNDWHIPQYIGLTEAPSIGYGAIYNDNVEAEDYEKIWYFGNYMLVDFGAELLEKGSVTFTKL